MFLRDLSRQVCSPGTRKQVHQLCIDWVFLCWGFGVLFGLCLGGAQEELEIRTS